MVKSKSWGAIRAVVLGGAVWAASLGAAQAAIVTYDFEAFMDTEILTGQLAGLTFSNATVLTAGVTLNEFEFPPASGINAVETVGGPLTIVFSSPVFSVSGLFTYGTELTFEAFDGATSLGFVTSASLDNRLLSGSTFTNELLSFANSSGLISSVVITGAISSEAFVLDNLTVDSGNLTTVPEPATLALLAGVLGVGVLPGGWMRRRRPY